jgi:hypothetical protein
MTNETIPSERATVIGPHRRWHGQTGTVIETDAEGWKRLRFDVSAIESRFEWFAPSQIKIS